MRTRFAQAYEVWRPLPVSYAQKEAARAMGRHLLSQSAIFPRLNSSLEEVKGKLVPRLTELMAACKVCVRTSCWPRCAATACVACRSLARRAQPSPAPCTGLAPHCPAVCPALQQALDTQGQGALSTEDVRACIKKTDVFLSR